MSWVGWLVAGGLAWLVVAIVVSLWLGPRLRERQPQEQDFFEDDEDPDAIEALFELLRQERP